MNSHHLSDYVPASENVHFTFFTLLLALQLENGADRLVN